MNRTKITTITVGATALIVALGCGAGSTGGDKKVNDGSGPVTAAPATTASKGEAPKPKAPTLTPKDIKLTVKVLEKQCFGSAGCNLQFRISGVSLPAEKLDKGSTYEITYTYKGLSDPVENRFTLNGDGSYEVDETEFGQTARSSAKVTAVVTSVEKM